MKTLRIGFMGTPDFSVPALRTLCQSDHEIICVYSQPPRPKGRGQKVQISPVHQYAQERGIPVLTPKNFKSIEVQEEFAAHNLDVAVVVAYGLILPQKILDAPQFGCLNIHASLLPRWRGASPIQQAIWAGDAQTGISIMQMEAGLDTGPVIAQQAVNITPQTTAASLHDDLAALGASMIVDVIGNIAREGKPGAKIQDDTKTAYAPLLKKEDGRIDWTKTAAEIDRQVRALNPWPGVWTLWAGQIIKIHAVSVSAQKFDQPAGTVIDRDGHIVCGGGTVLQVKKIQPAGKKAMDFSSALNGGYLEIGKTFS
jgi:methionyl-tRNA formyltransferase